MNRIIFLIPLSDSWLLAYQNTTDFWILIFYPATLLNSFIRSSSFSLGSLGFSMYSLMSFVNNDTLLLSFQFGCLLFLLLVWSLWLGLPVPCWINKSGESRYPCLVPNLKGNDYSFCPLSTMLAVGLSYMAFINFRYVLSIPTLLRVFIINECWVLSSAFSASIDMIIFVFFILFMWSMTFMICQYCTNLASLE